MPKRRPHQPARTDERPRRPASSRSEHNRLVGFLAAGLLVLAAAGGAALALTNEGDGGIAGLVGSGPDLAHVHGLGVNPMDGSLYIATHTGLWRAGRGNRTATRVGDSKQDVMGFSVVGPDRFFGSGHPGPGQSAPPNLGLIRSDDGGRSWEPVSLLGEADFHVLRSRGRTVYGFNGLSGTLMASRDGGRRWQQQAPPGPLIDLAIDPADPRRVVVSTDEALFGSSDAGGGWRPLADDRIGLLAWPERERLYFIDGSGQVSRSEDCGRVWREMGSIGAQPAAFAAADGALYAALPDGTVKRSSDDGATWSVRVAP